MTSDQDPIDAAIDRLNEAFYANDPGRFFKSRALSLMFIGDQLGSEEVVNGEFTARVFERVPGWELRPGEDEEATKDLLALESFMLAHHVGEALLRHVFAQMDANPRFPAWFALVQLQMVRRSTDEAKTFRDRVSALLELPFEELKGVVEELWLPGRVEAEADGDIDSSEIEKRVEFLAGWIRYFARAHLEDGNGYNAAKHGLSSIPHQNAMVVFSPDSSLVEGEDGQMVASQEVLDQAAVMMQGTVLETLEHTWVREVKQGYWQRVMRGVDVEGLLAVALNGARMLTLLWRVGDARASKEGKYLEIPYTGASPSVANVKFANPRAWSTIKMPIVVLPQEAPALDDDSDPDDPSED